MAYEVRVKDGALMGGLARDGARFNILPGTYDVEKTSQGDLVFFRADTRDSGDLVVQRGEYLELKNFPDINQNPYIEIIK